MRLPSLRMLSLLAAVLVLAGCADRVVATPPVTPTPSPTAAPTAPPADDVSEAPARDERHSAHRDVDEHDHAATDVSAEDPAGTRAADAGAPNADGLPTAEALLAATREHAPRWADITDAEAAGYRSIGDAFTGYEHLVHPGYQADPTILDPERPESLVYRVEDGEKTLVSAMYVLPLGATMEDVPDLGDDRATWHLHDDLCFDEQGRLAGVFSDGECLFGGEHVVTPPMLHVWVIDHPCGPFAGIEGHGGGCGAHQH